MVNTWSTAYKKWSTVSQHIGLFVLSKRCQMNESPKRKLGCNLCFSECYSLTDWYYL